MPANIELVPTLPTKDININVSIRTRDCNDLYLYDEPNSRIDKATFAMGCVWIADAIFGCTPGVVRTRVGYAQEGTKKMKEGGTMAVELQFDTRKTNYLELIDIFWRYHNPTVQSSKNKSIIFYHNPEQQRIAELTLKQEVKQRGCQIKTKIFPVNEFCQAELCHQKYFLQNYPHILKKLDIEVGLLLIQSKIAARLNGYVAGYRSTEEFEVDSKRLNLCFELVEYIRQIRLNRYTEFSQPKGLTSYRIPKSDLADLAYCFVGLCLVGILSYWFGLYTYLWLDDYDYDD